MPGGHSRVTYIQQVPVLLGNWFYEAHGGSTLSERGLSYSPNGGNIPPDFTNFLI